jgi:hypothetical protein
MAGWGTGAGVYEDWRSLVSYKKIREQAEGCRQKRRQHVSAASQTSLRRKNIKTIMDVFGATGVAMIRSWKGLQQRPLGGCGGYICVWGGIQAAAGAGV